MKRILLMTVGVAIGAASLLAGGCTPPGENMVTSCQVTVEKQSQGKVQISRVDVYQDGETLVVDGSLTRSLGYRQMRMGHVDVAVLGPDGAILSQKGLRDTWSDRGISTFIETRLPIVAPNDSTVRVLFHDSHKVPASGHTPEEWEALWRTTVPKT